MKNLRQKNIKKPGSSWLAAVIGVFRMSWMMGVFRGVVCAFRGVMGVFRGYGTGGDSRGIGGTPM